MQDSIKVLITGASGDLGNKIRRHLKSRHCYELILLDLEAKDDPAIIKADLSRYDESWAKFFRGVHTIVHLAAEAKQNAPWESLKTGNIDAVINVYQAAAAHQARRLIFASSNATMAGYLKSGIPIDTKMPTWPTNYYGVTKVMGESLGKSYAERHGLSLICLRIGWVGQGENPPNFTTRNLHTQQRWLSNRDLCQGIEKAILAADVEFAVLNLMSNNHNMPWDLTETCLVIGYQPEDGITPKPPPKIKRWLTRFARVMGRLMRYCARVKASIK